MSTARRQLIRSLPVTPLVTPQQQRRLQKLRTRLEQERAALARWMTRLRRAFHAVERGQARLSRIEKQIVRLEQ
jgi:exonuclease VII small subunit